MSTAAVPFEHEKDPYTEARHVLVVEPDVTRREAYRNALLQAGITADTATEMRSAELFLEHCRYDAVLLNTCAASDARMRALAERLQRERRGRLVLITDPSETRDEASLQDIAKTRSRDVQDVVGSLMPTHSPKLRRVEPTDGEARPDGVAVNRDNFGIIGRHPSIMHVIEQVRRIGLVDSNVLIVGESGTGKELVARAIYSASRLNKESFAAINCGAIPANLLESELFGHHKGAFTDARKDRKGLFVSCNNGTILLDEIGDMPLDLQVKLLRVLQEKEVTPLGSNQPVKVNARVIAATNCDLVQQAEDGTFRQDLFYRLSVLTVHVPPLRERKSDISLLLRHLLDNYNRKFSKDVAYPERELESRLMAYSWPGNIRELQNAVERGVVLSTDGNLKFEDMIPPMPNRSATDGANLDGEIFTKGLTDAKREFERMYLENLLKATGGNIAEASRVAKRYRAHIYRLLTKHGVEWDEFRLTEF